MKDDRFIELVNLYIDRQITGEETAALEAEIQASPRRRAVYRQYCQMHRATTLVYESFRTETVGQTTEGGAAKENIARFEPQPSRRRTSWAYYATGLAAACVALVFARVSANKPAPQNIATTAIPAKQTVAVAAVQSPVIASPVSVSVAQVVPTSVRTSNLVAEQDYAAMLAAVRQEEQRAFANGQIQPSRSSSLFEDGIFDSQPASSSHGFKKKPTAAQQSEFAAFQFQR